MQYPAVDDAFERTVDRDISAAYGILLEHRRGRTAAGGSCADRGHRVASGRR